MKLTSDQVNKLKVGSIIYYNEYSPGQEKTTFDDILLVIDHTKYVGPEFKVLASKINKPGEITAASTFEISNGRAYAIPDKDFIIKLLFEKDLW